MWEALQPKHGEISPTLVAASTLFWMLFFHLILKPLLFALFRATCGKVDPQTARIPKALPFPDSPGPTRNFELSLKVGQRRAEWERGPLSAEHGPSLPHVAKMSDKEGTHRKL